MVWAALKALQFHLFLSLIFGFVSAVTRIRLFSAPLRTGQQKEIYLLKNGCFYNHERRSVQSDTSGLLTPQVFLRWRLPLHCNSWEVLLGMQGQSPPDPALQRSLLPSPQISWYSLLLKSTPLDHIASKTHICPQSLLEGSLLLSVQDFKAIIWGRRSWLPHTPSHPPHWKFLRSLPPFIPVNLPLHSLPLLPPPFLFLCLCPVAFKTALLNTYFESSGNLG